MTFSKLSLSLSEIKMDGVILDLCRGLPVSGPHVADSRTVQVLTVAEV